LLSFSSKRRANLSFNHPLGWDMFRRVFQASQGMVSGASTCRVWSIAGLVLRLEPPFASVLWGCRASEVPSDRLLSNTRCVVLREWDPHQQLTYSACSVVCQAQCRTDLKEREILVAARRDKAGATARRRWIRAWPAYSHAEYAPPPCRSPTAVGGTRHPCHATSLGHAIPLFPTEALDPPRV
jgi:hypothetical protein